MSRPQSPPAKASNAYSVFIEQPSNLRAQFSRPTSPKFNGRDSANRPIFSTSPPRPDWAWKWVKPSGVKNNPNSDLHQNKSSGHSSSSDGAKKLPVSRGSSFADFPQPSSSRGPVTKRTASVAGNGIRVTSARQPQVSSKPLPMQPLLPFLAPGASNSTSRSPPHHTSLVSLSNADKLKLLTLINSLAISQDKSESLESQVKELQHQLISTSQALRQSMEGEGQAKRKCEELAADIHSTMGLVVEYEEQVARIQADLEQLKAKSSLPVEESIAATKPSGPKDPLPAQTVLLDKVAEIMNLIQGSLPEISDETRVITSKEKDPVTNMGVQTSLSGLLATEYPELSPAVSEESLGHHVILKNAVASRAKESLAKSPLMQTAVSPAHKYNHLEAKETGRSHIHSATSVLKTFPLFDEFEEKKADFMDRIETLAESKQQPPLLFHEEEFSKASIEASNIEESSSIWNASISRLSGSTQPSLETMLHRILNERHRKKLLEETILDYSSSKQKATSAKVYQLLKESKEGALAEVSGFDQSTLPTMANLDSSVFDAEGQTRSDSSARLAVPNISQHHEKPLPVVSFADGHLAPVGHHYHQHSGITSCPMCMVISHCPMCNSVPHPAQHNQDAVPNEEHSPGSHLSKSRESIAVPKPPPSPTGSPSPQSIPPEKASESQTGSFAISEGLIITMAPTFLFGQDTSMLRSVTQVIDELERGKPRKSILKNNPRSSSKSKKNLSKKHDSGAAATSSSFRTISKSNNFPLDIGDGHYHSHGLKVLNHRISELERTNDFAPDEEVAVEEEDLDDVISSLNGGI